MSRQISKTIRIDADRMKVYEALLLPSAIKSWWEAQSVIVIREVGGLMCITWGADLDAPDYVSVSRILEMIPGQKLKLAYENYKNQSHSLPFEANMIVKFELIEMNGQCNLAVTQTGFPDGAIADDYYQGCIIGWETTLKNIKSYLQS